MIGILSETTHDSPSPFYYDPADFPETFSNGWSTARASTNYTRPWRGDTLHFRDAIEYMLTGSLAVLDAAAKYRQQVLYGAYQMGRRQIDLGGIEAPVAYVIPREQHDPPTVAKFVEILLRGAIEVHEAQQRFQIGAQTFDAGSYVVLLAQPFRPFAKDLLEPQRYPDIRRFPGGPPVPPYDNAGWTLSYQMGVATVPVAQPFDVELVRLDTFPKPPAPRAITTGTNGYMISPRTNSAFAAVNRLLADGFEIRRLEATNRIEGGTFYTPPARALNERVSDLAHELGLIVQPLMTPARLTGQAIRPARIGLYQSWVVEWVDGFTSSEGWARYVLDHFDFPYERITNDDVRAGDLRTRFDVLIVPSQDVDDIVHGYRAGRRNFGVVHQNLPPPDYQGGIEADGIEALRRFAARGGRLVLVDKAADLGTERLGLPVHNVVADLGQEEFFGPGSVVRLFFNRSHPLAFGMPDEGAGYFRKSRAFESDDPTVQVIARYDPDSVLLSGWMNGAAHLAGRAAAVEIPTDAGSVVLFGFPVYFRAQPHGTFKLLFNALYVEPNRR